MRISQYFFSRLLLTIVRIHSLIIELIMKHDEFDELLGKLTPIARSTSATADGEQPT